MVGVDDVIFFLFKGSFQDTKEAFQRVVALKQGNVPVFGRRIVWLVLFLGCAGFVAKGIIQLSWEGTGLG